MWQMCIHLNSEATICPASETRIQNQRNWSESTYFHRDFGIVKMIAASQENQISYCQNIKRSFSCFWHGHEGCRYFVWPKNNAEFWKEKITRNIQRDKHNRELLSDQGWRIIEVWECELKKKSVQETLNRLVHELHNI